MLSKIAYLLCTTVMLYCCFVFYPKWDNRQGEAAIGWDVSGYYWYLPSIFIYKDLKYQSFADSILREYEPTPEVMQFTRAADGSCVMTYSGGMAIMYSPLFAIAHMAAKSLGYPADGFSRPYQFAIQVGSLLISLLGLWLYRKVLLYYFSDKVTAILLLILTIGSNYLNYAAIDGAQTHAWLFALYALLLLSVIRFYKKPDYKYAVAIGVLCGFAILIRPSEMICVLIPLLWGMDSVSMAAIREKLQFLKTHRYKLAVAIVCVLLIGSIQLIYWKYASGQWLVYSYGTDKTFSWLHPHLFDYTLSARSGWLTYTPAMIFSLIGIIPFMKRGQNKVAILSFCLLNLYIVCAWDIWWYGGTGGRAMIQSYPFMFLPLGYLVQLLTERKVLRWALTPFILLFCYVNIWFTVNAHAAPGLYDSNGMSRAYYWRVVGRWHIENRDEVEKLKDTDELFTGIPQNLKLIYTHDFNTDINPADSFYIGSGMEFSNKFSLPVDKNAANWLRIEATISTGGKEWTQWRMPQFTAQFLDKDNNVLRTRMLRIHRFLNDNETKDFSFDVSIASDEAEKVDIYLKNPGSDKWLLVKHMEVRSFND